MTTQNRKKPSKKRKKVWRKAQGQAPRSTRKGTKLTFTSSTSPEIRTKQRKARRPSKVTVRYECPLCGGPHKKDEHDTSDTDAVEQRCVTCGRPVELSWHPRCPQCHGM